MKKSKKWLSAQSVVLALSMTGLGWAQDVSQTTAGEEKSNLVNENRQESAPNYSQRPESTVLLEELSEQGQAVHQPEDVVQKQSDLLAKPADVEEAAQPLFTVIEDGVHLIKNVVNVKYPVHYYGFVVQRGQDVLIGLPNGEPEAEAWKVEYTVSGEWAPLNFRNKVLKDLQVGDNVIIRVSPRPNTLANEIPYTVSFGSYPVMKKYDLLDEPGVLRIPSGYTVPDWLATQIYKEAVLNVEFSDTKGAPLKGGIAVFELSFGKNEKSETRVLISGADGTASERIHLGACYGGYEAKEFTDKNRGFNTWKSWYRVGGYHVRNILLETAPPNPHRFYLGHICTQRVQKTVAPRG